MHRQSLGSPSSAAATAKHHYAGNGTVTILTSSEAVAAAALAADDDEEKRRKPQRLHLKTAPAEKLIHLIPLLTLLCFLILYLSSHDPAQKDLAQFNGFKRLQKPIDSENIADLDEILETRKGDILAIRSSRNLQEIDREASYNRRHRKIADF